MSWCYFKHEGAKEPQNPSKFPGLSQGIGVGQFGGGEPFIYKRPRGLQVSADATGVDEVSLVTNEPEAFFGVQTALDDGSPRIQTPPKNS